MLKRLRKALARHWGWLWRRDGKVLGRLAGKTEHDEARAEARAHFWAELREGQREAEAQCARLRP